MLGFPIRGPPVPPSPGRAGSRPTPLLSWVLSKHGRGRQERQGGPPWSHFSDRYTEASRLLHAEPRPSFPSRGPHPCVLRGRGRAEPCPPSWQAASPPLPLSPPGDLGPRSPVCSICFPKRGQEPECAVAQRWHLRKHLCKHTHAGHTHTRLWLTPGGDCLRVLGARARGGGVPGVGSSGGVSEEGSAPARPPSCRGPRCSWLLNTSPRSPLPSLHGVLPAAGAAGPSVPFFIRTLVMLDQGHPHDLIFI